jgi:hypothetical protein
VPETSRRFDPPRPILVLHDDGRWYEGYQDGWTRWPDGSWRASVSYTTEPGSKYLRSLPAERIQVVEGS